MLKSNNKNRKIKLLPLVFLSSFLPSLSVQADMKAAEKWIDQEFQLSTPSRQQELNEIKWFIDAAKPFQGYEIKVVSEGIDTHWYEASVVPKACYKIIGIKVKV